MVHSMAAMRGTMHDHPLLGWTAFTVPNTSFAIWKCTWLASRPVPHQTLTAPMPCSSTVFRYCAMMVSRASSQVMRSQASFPRSSRARLIGYRSRSSW